MTVRERVKSMWSNGYETKVVVLFTGTLEEIWERYKPTYRNKYLENGKLYQKGDMEY